MVQNLSRSTCFADTVFGSDWNGATSAEVDLRFPGQWADESWADAALGSEVYYNVHRWLAPGTGTYGQPDPLYNQILEGGLYTYASSNSLTGVDPLGLAPVKYSPRKWVEIAKICGPGKLGCTDAGGRSECECKSVKRCWWFARPRVRLTFEVFYAEDCDSPEQIIGHENRHVTSYENSAKAAEDAGFRLSRKRFTDKSSCDAACSRWKAATARRLENRTPHDLINFFSRPRGCHGIF